MNEPAAPPAEPAAAEADVRRPSARAPTCGGPSTPWATSTRRRCSVAVFEPAAEGRAWSCKREPAPGRRRRSAYPIVDRLVRPSVKAVQALILCPTRELALQVSRELEQHRSVPRDEGRRHLRRRVDVAPDRGAGGRRADRRGHAGTRPRSPAPEDARSAAAFASSSSTRPTRCCRWASPRSCNAILETLPEEPPGPLLQRHPPARHRAACAQAPARDASSSHFLPTRSERSRSVTRLRHAGRRQGKPARAHPRGRGPRERHHLLQYARRDPARRRCAQERAVSTPTGSTGTFPRPIASG